MMRRALFPGLVECLSIRKMILLGLAFTLLGSAGVWREVARWRVVEPDPREVRLAGRGFLPLTVPLPAVAAAPASPPAAQAAQAQSDDELLEAAPWNRWRGQPARDRAGRSFVPPIWKPDRLVIPAIGLDATIKAASFQEIEIGDQTYFQWLAPNERAVGWHETSATLGRPGNTVFNGHHNVAGEVFRYLEKLSVGDVISVYSGEKLFLYQVQAKMILLERGQPLQVRLANAAWIEPTQDELLTLVTCWPYTSNTHRLIIVATPIEASDLPPTLPESP